MMDKENMKLNGQLAFVCLLLGFVLILLTSVYNRDEHNSADTPWPLQRPVANYSFYVQQADAWLKGQAALDVEADPALLAMENPYDTAKRQELKVPYLFDRALYEGKYYSYFGTAPLILVYFPYFFLTGRFPSFLFTSTVFALGTLPGLLWALHGLFRYFKVKYKDFDFICLYLGLVTGSLLPYALRCADRYFLPFQSAMFALAWILAASFCALNAEDGRGRAVWHFASAGLGVVVLLQSRPQQLLFAALLLAPFYIAYLLDKERPVGLKVRAAAAFALPLLIGFGLTFYYNRLRFSGILDFGMNYQLTLADVNTYKLRPEWLGASFYSSFLTPISPSPDFPFFKITSFTRPLEHFLYRGPIMGLLVIPLNWLLFLAPLMTLGLRARKKLAPLRRPYIGSAVLGLVCLIFLSWYEFCKAGSLMRYNCDLSIGLAFLACYLALPLLKAEKSYLPAAIVSALGLQTFLFVVLMPRV